MCKICKGKDLKCKCRNKFIGNKFGALAKFGKDGKIINQKGAFGNAFR